MDVSGCILRAWMPAIHAGMTEAADGEPGRRTLTLAWRGIPPFSFSVGPAEDHELLRRHILSLSRSSAPRDQRLRK